MANLQSSEDFYAAILRLSALSLGAAQRLWSQVTLADLDGSWESVGPQLAALMAVSQTAAARRATAYVPLAAAEQGITIAPVADVRPESFGWSTADGRPISGLMLSPLTATKSAVAQRVADPLAVGWGSLERIVLTEIADAGRQATGVAQAVTPELTVYVRMLQPPSCSRCAILAGRRYPGNRGFLRHPRCDCVHVPSSETVAGDLTTDPKAYFDSLPPAEQDRIFTKAGAQAIRDGADMGQVVNARRGMYDLSRRPRTVDFGRGPVRITNEGTTARGYATTAPGSSVARRGGIRLAPEAIYEVATSQDDVLRLLRANGYIR